VNEHFPSVALRLVGYKVQGRIKLVRIDSLRDTRQIPARSVACYSPDGKQESFHKGLARPR
jgi:hypothetical protein